MRNGGNFYIDVIDVIASAKVVNLHALLKYDLLPSNNDAKGCTYCKEPLHEDDVETLSDSTSCDTIQDDTLRHKVVFIAGHLVHKYGKLSEENEEEISNEFIDELNRGGLCVPTISTVHFVHSAFILAGQASLPRFRCRNYLIKLFGCIDAPFASNKAACRTLSNIILKAYVLDNSDKEKEIGCLRRREKLSDK